MTDVDIKLAALEKRITKVYEQAADEAQVKLEKFLKKHKVNDAKKKSELAAGKITQQEYNKWKADEIILSRYWHGMRNVLANDYIHANEIAAALIKGELPDVYATGHNFAAYQIENDTEIDLSFSLYDRRTVERLLEKDVDLLPEPRVDVPKDEKWNSGHIQSAVLQGILQGESMPEVAERLKAVAAMNATAAIRNARTAVNGAENAGRVDSYKHAQEMGIELEQEWLATLDGRTRSSHRHLDGERVKVGKKFSNGCRFPGDPQGPPWEVYNCRCTLVAAIKGIDQSNAPRNSKLGSMSYDEWKNEHKQNAENQKSAEWQAYIDKSRAEMLSEKPNKQAMEMWKRGYLDHDTAVAQMRNGTISESVNRYWDIMAENGDPKPAKRTIKQLGDINAIAKEKYKNDMTSARIGEIMESTGINESEARKYLNELQRWTGSNWNSANTDVLDEYVEKAPAFDGQCYRGMHFTDDEFEEFMQAIDTGVIHMKKNSSWTTNEETARSYAHVNDKCDSVILHCMQNKTATPVEYYTVYGGEDELLAHSKTEWSVLSVKETEISGYRKVLVTVVEKGAYRNGR